MNNRSQNPPRAGGNGAKHDPRPERDAAPAPHTEHRSTHWSAYLMPATRIPFTWQADGAWDDEMGSESFMVI